MERGDSLKGALAFVNRALDKRGVVAFDRTNASIRNDAVATTVGASLALLSPVDRVRATELAIFAEAKTVPLSAAAAVWGLDDFETEDLVQRLDDASLVEFDLKTGQLRMHDVLRSHLLAQLGDASKVHGRLVKAGWPDDRALPDAFAWRWIGWHLVQAGESDRLRELLLDFTWLTAKLRATDVQALIRDFENVGPGEPHTTIRDALRLAAYSIDRDPEQLAVQLSGRVDRGRSSAVDQLLDSVPIDGTPRFRFGYPSLTHPGGPLVRILKGHASSIETIVVSPDEKFALTGSADWTLRLWDLESWRVVRSFEGHSGTVHAAAFTPDGRRIVSASEDRTLRMWDVETGQCLSILRGHHEAVRGIAVASNGIVAASLAEDGSVLLWDLQRAEGLWGQPPDSRKPSSRHLFKGGFHQLRGVAFMPDGAHVLFGAGDGTVRMLEVATGSEARIFEGHTATVNAMAIASDGLTALSASDDATVRLWDIASGRTLTTFRGHEGSVGCIALEPGGRRAASGGSDKTLRIWDVQTGQQTDMMEGHAGTIRSLAVLHEGTQIVTASTDRTVCCWTLDGPRPATPFQRQASAVSMVGISADGRSAVSGSSSGTLAVWHMEGEQATRALDGHTQAIQAVRMTADGRRALTASRDRTLRVWDLDAGRIVHVLTGHSDGVSGAAMTSSGSRAVSLSADRTIRLWDLERGMTIRVLIGSDSERRLAYLRGRGLLASETETALEIDTTTLPISRGALLAISADGTRVVFAHEGTVGIWQTDTGRVVAATVEDFDAVELAVDSNTRLAVVGSILGTLCVIDLEQGVWLHTLDSRRGDARTSRILDIAVDSSNLRTVTASGDGTFHFWDLSSGQETGAFSGGVEHADAVAIAPDARFAYSVVGDTIVSTDLTKRLRLRSLSLDHNITALAVAPEGANLVVGDESGRVHFLCLEHARVKL
jgi:WD40 repeat protein